MTRELSCDSSEALDRCWNVAAGGVSTCKVKAATEDSSRAKQGHLHFFLPYRTPHQPLAPRSAQIPADKAGATLPTLGPDHSRRRSVFSRLAILHSALHGASVLPRHYLTHHSLHSLKGGDRNCPHFIELEAEVPRI